MNRLNEFNANIFWQMHLLLQVHLDQSDPVKHTHDNSTLDAFSRSKIPTTPIRVFPKIPTTHRWHC